MPNAADYFDAMRAMQSCASLKTLDFALLPPSAQELARVLGLPCALKMVEMYGGLTLRIPHGETPQGRSMLDDIAKHIGEPSSRALAQKSFQHRAQGSGRRWQAAGNRSRNSKAGHPLVPLRWPLPMRCRSTCLQSCKTVRQER